MPKSQLLRINRTDDEEGTFVLVNVEVVGPASLDLRLTGTDGSSPFVGQFKQSEIGKLRSKGHTSPIEEWTATVSMVFLKAVEAGDSIAAEDLELVASVNDTNMTITVRKNIGGITQRLGMVSLEQDDEVEIALFDWSGQAAIASDKLRAELTTMQSTIKEHKKALDRLNAQLDKLTEAKKEHEAQMIRKFTELLNAKKLKIRDQQRLLAGAEASPKAGSKDKSAGVSSVQKRAVGSSRPGKRKAAPKEEESDDGFEVAARRSDQDDEEERREMDEQGTPEPSDQDETEGSDEDDRPRSGADQVSTGPDDAHTSIRGDAMKDKARPSTRKSPSGSQPPPRRELPFNRKVPEHPVSDKGNPTSLTGKQKAADNEADDDDETDDEL